MKLSRFLSALAAAAAIFGSLLTQGARGQDPPPADILYIGDGGTDTIKSFDAESGALVGESQGPGISGLA